MIKRILCVGILVCMLCASCGRFQSDVSSGDEVVISKALQDKENGNPKLKAAKEIEKTEMPFPTMTPDAQEAAKQAETPLPTFSMPASTYAPIVSKEKIKLYDSTGTAVVGDTGYEIYNYVTSAAETYAQTINKATSKLGKSYHIYAMIAPTSVGVTLPDNKADKINSSNQQEAIRKIYKKIKKPVQKIDAYDALMQHRTEYIYFRTDHHWTALGAYYAYQRFCMDTDRTPKELSQYKKVSFGDFIGTFYADSCKNKNLRKDKMAVYYPQSKLSMKTRADNGKMVTSKVIEDGSGYGISAKYSSFLGGDNAYSVVTNQEIKDNSACIVVKESYGNALVPYLAEHYHKVHVIDYRYYTGKISTLAKQSKVQDILFVNNISMTRNVYLIGKLSQILQ